MGLYQPVQMWVFLAFVVIVLLVCLVIRITSLGELGDFKKEVDKKITINVGKKNVGTISDGHTIESYYYYDEEVPISVAFNALMKHLELKIEPSDKPCNKIIGLDTQEPPNEKAN